MTPAGLTAMVLLSVPLPLPGHPSVRPWPIGPGARYRPPAAGPSVARGRPLGALRCAAPREAFPLHLEIFVDRLVVVVPAGIGIARPWRQVAGSVLAGGCTYPITTPTPGGIVEVARGARLSLADLFRIWGQPLGGRRIASFRATAPLRAYVDGVRVDAPVGSIRLSPRAEIVLELGGYVVPHRFFLFAVTHGSTR